MKRSKVFLSLTGSILAIAGIAATKAHRTPLQPGFFTNAITNRCTASSSAQGFTATTGSGNIVTTIVGSKHVALYSKPNVSGLCNGKLLYTKTGE